jgi:hypothetical protein
MKHFNAIRDIVTGYLSLPDGWHYGEGVAAPMAVVSQILELIDLAEEIAGIRMNTFSGINGEVQLVISANEYIAEYTIESDNLITYTLEYKGGELVYEEGLSLGQAKDRIKKFGTERCHSSDSSTPRTTMTTSEGFPVWLLEETKLNEGSQFLWLTLNVPAMPLLKSVSTSDDTILKTLDLPPASGSFRTRYLTKKAA